MWQKKCFQLIIAALRMQMMEKQGQRVIFLADKVGPVVLVQQAFSPAHQKNDQILFVVLYLYICCKYKYLCFFFIKC